MREADLYLPVKRFLESQNYEVKGEIRECDVLALRGDLEVSRPRKAVADDRRLESHYGTPRVERRLDLRCNYQGQSSTHVNHDLAFTVASCK